MAKDQIEERVGLWPRGIPEFPRNHSPMQQITLRDITFKLEEGHRIVRTVWGGDGSGGKHPNIPHFRRMG